MLEYWLSIYSAVVMDGGIISGAKRMINVSIQVKLLYSSRNSFELKDN